MAVDWLVDIAENCKLPNPRVYYVGATYKSVRMVAWQMCKDLTAHLDVKKSEAELTITFTKNNAKLQLLSCTDFQKHRGIYIDAIVMDEMPILAPAAWTMVFRPACSDRNGKAMFCGTPQGAGFFYKLWKHGNTPEAEAWSSYFYTVLETDVIDQDEQTDLQATMPEHEWRQEFLCDWRVARRGAFFGPELNAMDSDGRIGSVPLVEGLPVVASWWLPKTDSSVILFWQEVGDELHLVDSIWKQQTSIAALCDEIANKPFDVSVHYASMVAQVDHYASRLSQARGMGLRFKLTQELPLIEKVYAAKPLLGRTRIDDEANEDAAEAFRQHHAVFDDVKQCYEDKPFEDWTVDFVGALTTFAAAHNPRRSDWSVPLVYPNRRRAA